MKYELRAHVVSEHKHGLYKVRLEQKWFSEKVKKQPSTNVDM